MAFFDDLGKTLNGIASEAADKVGELAESAKLRGKIASEKEAMKEGYEAIGRLVFEEKKDTLSEDSEDLVDKQCSRILENEAHIKDLEAKLKEKTAKETDY